VSWSAIVAILHDVRDVVQEQGDVRNETLEHEGGIRPARNVSVVLAECIIGVCVVVAQDITLFGMVVLEAVEPPTGIARVGDGEHLDAPTRNRAIEFERWSRHSITPTMVYYLIGHKNGGKSLLKKPFVPTVVQVNQIVEKV
jgi:hypothetical protein